VDHVCECAWVIEAGKLAAPSCRHVTSPCRGPGAGPSGLDRYAANRFGAAGLEP
jgi:hypothetical protein